MIIKNLDESSTPEEMRASERELKKLGLVPPDFQLRAFIISLLTEQVAGYYDPKTQEFYLADWIDVDAQKTVMAHELTHALQDQHFNLRRFEKWPKGDSDAELAAHALIEGDATLAMMYYALRRPKSASVEASPPAADNSTMDQLHKRGGWNGLSQAFTKLPQSTEQIMHPDKYFAGEAPVKVEMPNLAAKLGAKWRRSDYDVHGEWSLYLVLDEYLKADAEAKKAAAGWGGDCFALYEGAKPQEVMIAMLSVWDTEQDAREFFEAYARRTNLRYKTARSDVTTNLFEWQTMEGRVMLEHRGARVAILEGLPQKANAGDLMRSLWK
jgi:hypothetical protein